MLCKLGVMCLIQLDRLDLKQLLVQPLDLLHMVQLLLVGVVEMHFDVHCLSHKLEIPDSVLRCNGRERFVDELRDEASDHI